MHAVLLVNMLNLAISKILDMNVKVKGLFSCSTFNFSLSMLSSLLKIGNEKLKEKKDLSPQLTSIYVSLKCQKM